MQRVQRPKPPGERVASTEELVEDRRRCLAARPRRLAAAPVENAGNLCAMLRAFAGWRECSACGDRVLFCDENLKTDTRFLCGRCEARREAMGARCKPSLPARAALLLRGLFSTANDNGKAVPNAA